MARQRRERGQGSVYQDSTGQWWVKVPIGGGQTRRARAATRSEAERRRKEFVAERDAGVNLRASQQTLRVYLAHWLTDKRETVKPSTLEFYVRHVEYALPHIGHIRLEDLEPDHVRKLLRALRADGLSVRSCRHVRRVLGTALKRAYRDGAVKQNIIDKVEAPAFNEDSPEFEGVALAPAQIVALLDACEGRRHGLLVRLALALGLRQGELIALRWPDLDLDAGALTIRDAKSRAGRRTLPLTVDLVTRLREHWTAQQDERAVAAQRAEDSGRVVWREHGLVFPSETGTPILGSNLRRWFYGRLAAAKLPRIRFHDLRGTAISEWIAGGADPKAAQALAGHSDPTVTMKVYAKAQTDRLRPAVEGAEERRRKREG